MLHGQCLHTIVFKLITEMFYLEGVTGCGPSHVELTYWAQYCLRAALDMLKKSVRQGGSRKPGGGKDVEGADAPEQLRKLQLQVNAVHMLNLLIPNAQHCDMPQTCHVLCCIGMSE